MDAKPLNILFFLPDQQRADWLGDNPALGLRTPNMDRMMAEGTTFTRAYTPSPLCAPARACLASGMDYEHCRVPGNHCDYPLDLPTYYQRLRDAGYRVCGVGKFDLHKDTSDHAKLDWHPDGSRLLAEWGFTAGIDNEGKIDGSNAYRFHGGPRGPYLSYLHARGLAEAYVEEHARSGETGGAYVTALPEDAYCDNWLSENGLRFLRDFPAGEPWHLVVNFTGPHGPFDVTERMLRDVAGHGPFPMPHGNPRAERNPELHQRRRRHYAAMVQNIDRQIGRFMEALEARGELDRTLVVYSSDHGEMLGDYGRWGKCVPQEGSIHVPLVVRGPGVRAGLRTDALVCLHDLTATFLETAGAPALPGMEGRSLMPALRGDAAGHREHVRVGLGEWRAAMDSRWKLVAFEGGRPRLYDLCDDPWEDRDVAGETPAVVARLEALL